MLEAPDEPANARAQPANAGRRCATPPPRCGPREQNPRQDVPRGAIAKELRMSSIRSTWVAAAAGVAALGLAASAAAQAPGEATTISVAPRVLVAAPQKSPVDFPGVAKARGGQPLPNGYVAV